MSEQVTYDSMMRVLPSVLKKSVSMEPLGEVIAKHMKITHDQIKFAYLYSRIYELDEGLLDILATDFNVTWYDYDYNVETKRRVILESFYVHKYLGTIGATRKALCAVWPGSKVEEWFDYGGQPYHFRVILYADVTTEPIRVNSALNAIMFYKSARSHLESNIPIVCVSFGMVIQTKNGNMIYHVRSCGTEPRVSTHGNKSDNQIIIETETQSAKYHNPSTGQITAGLHPRVSMHGDLSGNNITVETISPSAVYHNPLTGQAIAGTYPSNATHGDIADGHIVVENDSPSVVYHNPVTGQATAGTTPHVTTHGGMDDDDFSVGISSFESTYTARPCGTSLNSLL